MNSGTGQTSSALADEKTRQGAMKLAQGMSLSKDASIWMAGKIDADDWERRNRVMAAEETSGDGMSKVSFRVKNGRVTGRVQRDGKGGYRGYYDRGGSSFGTNQFTTTNMLEFLNKKD